MVDGKQLKGCGGHPGALLQGAEWVVEDINGTGIIDSSRVTLNFSADRRISGRASSNTYTGAYTLTGETLTISKTGVTMMACAPALMRQEDLFLDILKNVRGFELAPDGALLPASPRPRMAPAEPALERGDSTQVSPAITRG